MANQSPDHCVLLSQHNDITINIIIYTLGHLCVGHIHIQLGYTLLHTCTHCVQHIYHSRFAHCISRNTYCGPRMKLVYGSHDLALGRYYKYRISSINTPWVPVCNRVNKLFDAIFYKYVY